MKSVVPMFLTSLVITSAWKSVDTKVLTNSEGKESFQLEHNPFGVNNNLDLRTSHILMLLLLLGENNKMPKPIYIHLPESGSGLSFPMALQIANITVRLGTVTNQTIDVLYTLLDRDNKTFKAIYAPLPQLNDAGFTRSNATSSNTTDLNFDMLLSVLGIKDEKESHPSVPISPLKIGDVMETSINSTDPIVKMLFFLLEMDDREKALLENVPLPRSELRRTLGNRIGGSTGKSLSTTNPEMTNNPNGNENHTTQTASGDRAGSTLDGAWIEVSVPLKTIDNQTIPNIDRTFTLDTVPNNKSSGSFLDQLINTEKILDQISILQMENIIANWKVVEFHLNTLRQNDSGTNSTTFSDLTPTEQDNVRAKFVELNKELQNNGLKLDKAFEFHMKLRLNSNISRVTPDPDFGEIYGNMLPSQQTARAPLLSNAKYPKQTQAVEQLMYMTKQLDKFTNFQLAKFKEGWNAFKVYLESLNSDSIKPTKIELSHFKANEIKPVHLLFVDSIKEMGQSSGIQKNDRKQAWNTMNEYLHSFQRREDSKTNTDNTFNANIEKYIAGQMGKIENNLRYYPNMKIEKIFKSWAMFRQYLEALTQNSASLPLTNKLTILTPQENIYVRKLFIDFFQNALNMPDLKMDKLIETWGMLERFMQSLIRKYAKFASSEVGTRSNSLVNPETENIYETKMFVSELEQSIKSKLESLKSMVDKGDSQSLSTSLNDSEKSNRELKMKGIEESFLKASKYLASA